MSLRTWGVLSLGLSLAACANPVDDQGYVDDQTPQGGAVAPAPVKGGYNGNVATDMPSNNLGGSGGAGGGSTGSGGGSGAEPPTHPEPGLSAYYDFDSATGYVFDVSGFGNHGTATPTGVSFTAPGRSGQAATFTGGHGSIVITSSPSLDFTVGASIEFWVRLSSVSSGTILSRGWGDNAVRVRTTQGNIQVVFSRASGGSAILTSSANTLGTAWSHVAVVNDGAELKLYLNGKLDSSVVGGNMGAVVSNLVIGKNENTDIAFNGTIDELKWWGVARTPAEICVDAGGTLSGASCSLP